jgi:2-polyprenyl-3-methyl-5-hydroxy-6-metoxy-1,4-benzoquinol methylase
MGIDKKNFWENKIQAWEKDRYRVEDDESKVKTDSSHLAGSSLQFRFESTAELLKPYLDGKKILDIGCGTGIFYNELKDTNLAHYYGFDFAENAILEGKKKFEGDEKCSLFASTIEDFDFPECDIAIALGVLDWLENDEIEALFKKTYPRKFLFAISEKKPSITLWIHAIYCFLSYGWKTQGYVPKYHTTDEIIKIAEAVGYKNIKIYRHPKLRFGAYVYSLD